MEYEKYVKHIPGDNVTGVFLFALSTCMWCRKTKALLKELEVDYKYVDVDTLEGLAKTEAVDEMEKWDLSGSFPLLIIGNSDAVLGFKEEKIRRLLGFD